jgi:hypothetical protein
MQEDLEWEAVLGHDSRDGAAWREKDWREAEAWVAVEQQLLQECVVAMAAELNSSRKELGVTRRAETELAASREALQQETVSKTGCSLA